MMHINFCIYKTEPDSDLENELMASTGKNGGVIVMEFGMNSYTLLSAQNG